MININKINYVYDEDENDISLSGFIPTYNDMELIILFHKLELRDIYVEYVNSNYGEVVGEEDLFDREIDVINFCNDIKQYIFDNTELIETQILNIIIEKELNTVSEIRNYFYMFSNEEIKSIIKED